MLMKLWLIMIYILIIVILIYNILQLDYVQRPSWQAQISGEKTWTLIPTPECEHVCTALNVTVSKGDISKYRYLEEGYPIGIFFKYKKKPFKLASTSNMTIWLGKYCLGVVGNSSVREISVSFDIRKRYPIVIYLR